MADARSAGSFGACWGLLVLLGLVALVALLWRRCRRRPHHDGDTMRIPSWAYRQPDPLLYSQPHLTALGYAVTWDNPDITIEHNGSVVGQGVWTWDSGHAGHLELHPVRAIAKLTGVVEGADPVAPVPTGVAARLNDLKDRWCRLLNDAAPPGVRVPDTPRMPMTTQQQQTALTQQQPEHQWTVHPVIDGCAPRGGGGTVHGGVR